MPGIGLARAAVLGEIRDLSGLGDDPLALLSRADEPVTRAVPADQLSWQIYDPDAMLPVGFYMKKPVAFEEQLLHCQIEQGTGDHNLFRDLATRPVPVATLENATRGNPGGSRRYRELLHPAGFRHEARVALVHKNRCWGTLTLLRSGNAGFTATEQRWLAAAGRALAAGLARRMTIRPAGRAAPGPGVLLIWPSGRNVMLNSQAAYWADVLNEPPWGPGRARGALLAGAIRALRLGPSRPVSLNLLTAAGWATAHASATERCDWATVVIDLARPGQVVPLLAAAYGLTAAEQAATALILRGMPAKEAARQLRISSGTVNDHLKSIYAKTGTSSRGQLQHLFALDTASGTVPFRDPR
jgi:DNA-binding CsgD family transcriptional regulator